MFEKYYESPAYGEWCGRVYGKDLKQLGCVTIDELEILYREVDLPPDSLILDMGCGPGYLSAEIASHYSARLTGVDTDEGSISHAIKAFHNNPAYHFVLGDGRKISYAASTFDMICFCDSLHFTRSGEELYELLDRCFNMLKPGGKLVIFCGKDNHEADIWGQKSNIPFKTIDLTETNKKLWSNVFCELVTMASELRVEIPETYERLKDECIQIIRNNGWLPRRLYILYKQ